MRILITNATLALRGGTEAYVQDLAVALRRAGHDVAVYSNILGEAALELRDAGIPVLDDLASAPWLPDIIHGHHHLETLTALLHFPGVPCVFVSHGWVKWASGPIVHPRVQYYVGVDGPTRDALAGRPGIPRDRIRLIPNFVDLDRFKRRAPLPPKPRRALVLSHYASERTYVPMIREACERRGVALDVMGYGVGRPVSRPERILGDYDLVFAKGRAALESLAVGAALVACDAFGLGPMVTTENVTILRTLEGDYLPMFSRMSVAGLVRQIERYDAADAGAVTSHVRSVVGADRAAAEFISLYERARAEGARTAADPLAESRAAAAHVRWVSAYIKERLVERDPLSGITVSLRNRLARVAWLAPALLRISAKIAARRRRP